MAAIVPKRFPLTQYGQQKILSLIVKPSLHIRDNECNRRHNQTILFSFFQSRNFASLTKTKKYSIAEILN
tara:strand:+ start:542 stop:751 length:210 start_codon:yes stop_codon:yes gene_type:complete